MSTHNYLDKIGLGQVWGKIKDYADPFIVTITSTTNAGTTTYSADKTFSEITTAYNNGKHCIAVSGANIYFLTVINSNLCRFTHHAIGTVTSLGTTDGVNGYKITNSNVVTRDSMIIYSSAKNFEIFAGRNSVVPKHNKDASGSYVSNQAQQYYYEGDLFWNNKDLLCKAMTDISNGDTLVEDTNYVTTTIADELKNLASLLNPEDDINIINLLAEYDFVAPIEDVDGYVITDVDENLIVI